MKTREEVAKMIIESQTRVMVYGGEVTIDMDDVTDNGDTEVLRSFAPHTCGKWTDKVDNLEEMADAVGLAEDTFIKRVAEHYDIPFDEVDCSNAEDFVNYDFYSYSEHIYDWLKKELETYWWQEFLSAADEVIAKAKISREA